MNPQNSADPQYDPKQRVGNELAVMQADEKVICEVKRHPIGIIGIYLAIGFILLVIAILGFAILPSLANDSSSFTSSQVTQIGAIVFLLVAIVLAIFGLIATKVYWGNKWIVTSDSVTQVNQTSLFNRQSAQLALSSIEDVTAEQNGILAQAFKYGVLKVETAGHREKFSFLYCPNPNFYARCILEAREDYEMELHGQKPDGDTPVQPTQAPPNY